MHVLAHHFGLASWKEVAQKFIDNRKHPYFDPSTTARIDKIADILSESGDDKSCLPEECYVNDFMCKHSNLSYFF